MRLRHTTERCQYALRMPRALILASTSRYRRELLERLRLPFEAVPPGVDEAPLAGECPSDLALRLASAKAQAVALRFTSAIVIGSDQVAELDGQALGKPGGHDAAIAQWQRMRGRTVRFHTAVAVHCAESGFAQQAMAEITATCRSVNDAEIECYLRADQPYDCAGSARSEALGIAMFESIHSDDPTGLIGLPLMRTCALLRAAGLDPIFGAGPT
jgi:septum formation protein